MTLDLVQLRAFVSVADTGSLGRSAETLNLTQPALSRTIKRLEERIGAELFERHSKGMQLTDIGRALMPHAVLLLHEAGLALEEVDAMRGLSKGTVRVGAVAGIACSVLPEAISRLTEKWPQLRVVVIEGVAGRLVDALLRHEIDLALAVAVPDTEDIVAVKDCHWQDNTRIVASLDHPLRHKQEIKLSDTLDQRWAIPPRGTGPYAHMERVFLANGLTMPPIVVETLSILVIRSLVVRSGYLSWLNEPMYAEERRVGLMDALSIPGASGTRTLTAFKRRSGILPKPTSKLLEELRQLTASNK